VFRRGRRFAIRNKYKIELQELWTKYEKANSRKCQQNTKTKLEELWTSTTRSTHRVVVGADVRRGGDGAERGESVLMPKENFNEIGLLDWRVFAGSLWIT